MSLTPGRARRSNLKKVDYAREQQFSDAEDVFEDSPDEEAPVRGGGRKSGGAGRVPRVAKRPPKASSSNNAATATAAVASSNIRAAPLGADAEADDLDDDGDGYHDDKPVFTEKGYDPTLPPLRERFPFLPEYEEDGSPKIDLIVGRRPVDEKEEVDDKNEESDKQRDNNGDEAKDDSDEDNDDEEEEGRGRRARRGAAKNTVKKSPSPSKSKKKPPSSPGAAASAQSGPVEYEYLVKYKGRSYLHLEWKMGADLESMNKSAKGIYRRYLKKIAQGTEDDLENPEVDPSFVIPEKILAEEEQEITVELTDKELLRWEKQREKELALEQKDNDNDDKEESNEVSANGVVDSSEEKKDGKR